MHFFFEKKEKTNQNLIEQIILERYHQYYRLALRYTHHEADACDIVQNGAYKSLRNCHTLKNPALAETWVYRIMLNECFRYLKQPQFLSYESMQEESGTELGVTEDSYENIDLQRALDTLPAKDKAIVILKFFEDKKLEEIAEILEENINTVKAGYTAALRNSTAHFLQTATKTYVVGMPSLMARMEEEYEKLQSKNGSAICKQAK